MSLLIQRIFHLLVGYKELRLSLSLFAFLALMLCYTHIFHVCYICAVEVDATCLLHLYIGTAWVQHVMYMYMYMSVVPSCCGYGVIRVYIRVHMCIRVCALTCNVN